VTISCAWGHTGHRFPPPWRADKIPGGYVVRDANGQALAYIYSRDSEGPSQNELRYPITGIAGCCARASTGHAAAPAWSVMKSRRRKIMPPGCYGSSLSRPRMHGNG
jgi:hypothetical protein